MNRAPQEALLQLFITFINAPENGKSFLLMLNHSTREAKTDFEELQKVLSDKMGE